MTFPISPGSRLAWALLLLISLPAHAGEALFGGEFTFENEKTAQADGHTATSDETRRARDAMAQKLVERCKERGNCHVTRSPRKWLLGFDYKVTYDDGWSFRISTDPAVVEIQTAPLTAAQFRAHKDLIQSDVFDVAAEVGVRPGLDGGGHIHMGVEAAFHGNATLFRNYLVDQVNHSELGMGIFGNDNSNAPLIGDLKLEQQKEFAAVIQEFDEGKHPTIVDLARAIQERVYTSSPHFVPPKKYQQQNVTRILDYADVPGMQTLEDRAISPQKNFEQFLEQIDLKQSRLDMLEAAKGRVKLDILHRGDFPRSLSERFYSYVKDAKKDWALYGKYAPVKLSEGDVSTVYPLQLLPDTEKTKGDWERTGVNSLAPCETFFQRAQRRLNPKRLLFFSY